MTCPNCRSELNEAATVCPRCGANVSRQPMPNAGPPATRDGSISAGWMALGFFVPLIGFILYLAGRPQHPQRARSAGLGALIGCGASVMILPLMAAILFPVFARARENARRAVCQSHLQQLSLATWQYAQNNNGRLPDLSSPSAINTALNRYIKDPKIFICDHGGPYQGNAALSLTAINEISQPASVVLFSESPGAHLQGSNFAYVDGHVKWQR